MFFLALGVTQAAQAQTFSVLHNFTGGGDGGSPYAGVTLDGAGDLYGTAAKGGVGYGTVYQLKHAGSGWVFTPIYSFTGGNDGAGPTARVIIGTNNNLYGTTIGGGGSAECGSQFGYQGCGTVFKLSPQPTVCKAVLCTWRESSLYRFTGESDGALPWLGDLVFDQEGNLYGTASAGGQPGSDCSSGCGVVFELTPSQGAWTEMVLHGFTGVPDGLTPYGGVIFDSAGKLYGTTSGGGASGYGTAFELTPSGSGWAESILYNFQGGSDGGGAIAGLTTDGAGHFYGATVNAGAGGGGTAFDLSSSGSGWTFTSLYGLSGSNNSGPVANLVVDSSGGLYGTSWGGGVFGYGSVFKLSYSDGNWVYTTLHDFTGGVDGANPASSVAMDSRGNLYGTTSSGGATGSGVIFEVVPLPTGPAFPIKASVNNRYLVDQNDVPFILVGDAPQSMFANISTDDARAYLADRASHGINALWCDLLVDTYVGGRSDGSTYDGVLPFTGTLPGGDYDLTTPNPDYFARVDAMIEIAASYNIVILLDSFETSGWMPTFEANGVANAKTWGQYIGNRYKNFPNIIWIMGNDFQTWDTSHTDNVLAENVMQGTASTDSNHLQTTELNYYISGSLDDSLLVPYTTLAGAYTYYPTYYEVLQEYNSGAATIPVFMEEGYYDGENYGSGLNPPIATNLMLRKQAYWTVLAGGLAGYMGGTQYYDFHTGWQSGIDDIAATELGYFALFTQSYAWYNLVPDQTHTVVIAGYGTPTGEGQGDLETDNYVTTARIADGSLILSYCPESATITVDLTKMRGPATAAWYDPTSNGYRTISGSPFLNVGSRSFTTPGNNFGGSNDWVLVLTNN